jgi:Uncharacterized protein conserved in bacteria (DUF2219)
MRSLKKLWPVLMCIFLFSPYAVRANEVFLTVDNDTVFGTDEEYTGGSRFNFDYHGFSLVYQLQFFTPQNTEATTPPAGQRPYAAFEKYGARYRDNLKSLYYDLGVYGARTGEELNGEFIQNSIHHKIAKKRDEDPSGAAANGWPTQISNKSGAQGDIKIGLFHESENLFAVMLYGTGETGTFIKSAGYGVTSRLGINIDKFSDNKFAPKHALFLEANIRSSHISQQNLLEGNEDIYAYAVDRENNVQQASLSLIAAVAGIKLMVGATYLTEEYKSQPSNDFTSGGHVYGTAGIGYRWQ